MAPEPGDDGGTATSAAALLRATVLFGGVAGVVLAAACAGWGGAAAAGAAIGATIAVVALSIGPLIMRTGSQASPPAVMALAMAGYLTLVVLLGGAYLVLGSVRWVAPGFVGLGLALATMAGIAGQLRASTRIRVLAFGSAADPAARSGEEKVPGQPEKPGGTRTRRD